MGRPPTVEIPLSRRGQVLPAMALMLPLVLLPVAAWTVEASLAAARQAALVELAAQGAEDAAQQVDESRFRAGGGLVVLRGPAAAAARAAIDGHGGARLVSLTLSGETVTVVAEEWVPLSLASIVGWRGITLHAAASARLASGYLRPSSVLPSPVRIFSSA